MAFGRIADSETAAERNAQATVRRRGRLISVPQADPRTGHSPLPCRTDPGLSKPGSPAGSRNGRPTSTLSGRALRPQSPAEASTNRPAVRTPPGRPERARADAASRHSLIAQPVVTFVSTETRRTVGEQGSLAAGQVHRRGRAALGGFDDVEEPASRRSLEAAGECLLKLWSDHGVRCLRVVL
jgi:hypothetical protein